MFAVSSQVISSFSIKTEEQPDSHRMLAAHAYIANSYMLGQHPQLQCGVGFVKKSLTTSTWNVL